MHSTSTLKVFTKSTEDPAAVGDGLRLFVTRYWPRGHSRDECDEWLPNLAPSETLLKSIHEGSISWRKFEGEYKREMQQGLLDESGKNPRMRNSGQKYVIRLLRKLAANSAVTLICTCPPEAEHCHRHVLKKLVEAG